MKLAQDFDQLINTFKDFLKTCDDALAPGKTQEERNKVRNAIQEYLKSEASAVRDA